MRRAARTDANHAEIRDTLRAIPGCHVFDTHALGGGYPDLVCHWRGRTIEIEVKDGSKPPSARALTDDEREYHRAAAASGVKVEIVESVADALRLVGIKS